MELQHSFAVPTSLDDAWKLFMDVEKVGSCFPGAKVTQATDAGFSGTVKVKLGPIVLMYAGSGSFVAVDEEAHRAVLEAKGKDKKGNGTAAATVTIQLSPSAEGTQADVWTDIAITGKPAQFGRSVMQDVSDKLLAQFSGCIERQLTSAPTGEEPVEPAPAPTISSTPGQVAGPTPSQQPRLEAAESLWEVPIDLGATVLPVLLRRYPGLLSAFLGGLSIGWLIGRRHSR